MTRAGDKLAVPKRTTDRVNQSTGVDLKPILVRWTVIAILSVAFSAAVIRHAREFGKLRMYPTYDDVSYIVEGLRWLDRVRAGLGGAGREYLHAPPHSPVQAALAMAAFALFGVNTWAPYAIDAVVVFALLAIVDAMLDRARVPQRVVICLFVLTTPLAAAAVTEFRPDVACGLATAGALVLIARKPIDLSTVRERRGAGVLLGAALLIKPSVFPFTILMAASAAGMVVLAHQLAKRGRVMWRPIVRDVAGPAGVLALLYYPFGWRDVVGYIRDNLVGKYAALWRPARGFAGNSGYYLVGLGGETLLGTHLYILLGVCLTAGFVAGRRRGWRQRRRGRPAAPPADDAPRSPALGPGLILPLLTLEAFLVPACNKVKNEFLGATFQTMLVLEGAMAAAYLLRAAAASKYPRAWASTICFLLLAAGVAALRGQSGQSIDVMDRQRSTIDDVYAALRGGAARAGTKPGRVFLTTAGPLNAHTLTFLAMRDGINLEFHDRHRSDDVNEYRSEFEAADMVVASNPETPDVYKALPSWRIQPWCVATLRSDRRWTQAGPERAGYLVFRRARAANAGE